MTDQTRHVTLCVTHPGGNGHQTLDHHVPEHVAERLAFLVRKARVGAGGRYVFLFTTDEDGPAWDAVPTDDATASALLAWLMPHMPEHARDAS